MKDNSRQPITAMNQLTYRQYASAAGWVRSQIVQPAPSTAGLEIELCDDSGALVLKWLGRHKISGIHPGAHLVVHGFVTLIDSQLGMYNPRYELVQPAT